MSFSKMVRDRLRAATFVAQAARTHAERATEGLTMTLGGEVAAPALFTALVALLDEQARRLEAAETAWREELADDAAPRAARDAAVEALVAAAVQARAVLVAVYGETVAARCGLQGATPRDGASLVPVAEALLKRFGEATAGVAPRLGLVLDPKAVLDPVRAALAAYLAAAADVVREAREAEAALMDRDRALGAYDEAFRHVAGTLTHLFALAGLPELAERVRPSVRRPGRTAVPAPGDDEGDDPAEPSLDDDA